MVVAMGVNAVSCKLLLCMLVCSDGSIEKR